MSGATGGWRGGTGREVRVAVVDSGLVPGHPHVGEVAGGVAIRIEGGAIREGPDWQDRLGHGTCVAGVLRAKAPAAQLYAVRVFFEGLKTTPEALAGALHWCARERMHVANLSLGVRDPAAASLIESACREAFDAGVAIVAAAHADLAPQYPALTPGVLAVVPDEACGWDELIYRDRPKAPFFAHGYARVAPGIDPRRNFRGPSIAAAHLSGIVACLIERDRGLRGEALIAALRDIARRLPAE